MEIPFIYLRYRILIDGTFGWNPTTTFGPFPLTIWLLPTVLLLQSSRQYGWATTAHPSE
jgi:hypothetical protein